MAFRGYSEGTAHLRVRTLVTVTPQSGVGTAGETSPIVTAGRSLWGRVQLRQADEVWPVTQAETYPRTQRKAPQPGSLGADRPSAPAPATSRPRPPAHRKGPPSSPGTGPSCPERGLPVLPGPPAAASWPVLAPGVSTLPAGALGLRPPGPSGLQLELRVSWAPRVQVGAPPRHGHPTRAGSLAPAAALLPSVPCAGGPQGGECQGARRPTCALPPLTSGASLPLAPLDWLFGALWGHCGVFPLGYCHPVIWVHRPLSCPQAWPASSLLMAAAEMGPRLPPPPGLWGLLQDHSSPGAKPALPPIRGADVWSTGVHRGEPIARPRLQHPRPGGEPCPGPRTAGHLPLGTPAGFLPGAPSGASLEGWQGETEAPRALPPPAGEDTCPLCEGRGGRYGRRPCPLGAPLACAHGPGSTAQGGAVGRGCPEAQEAAG